MEAPCHFRCGTAIAAIWTPDEVVIAADSADNEMRDGELVTVASACKIRVYGSFVVAAKGIRCGEPDFDVYSIGEQILSRDISLADAVARLESRLLKPLQLVAARLRDADWDGFYRLVQFVPLEVVIATNAGNFLQMAHVCVLGQCEADLSFKVKARSCPTDASGRDFVPLLLAPSTASYEAYRESRPQAVNSGDLAADARDFVQFMIEREEPGVGSPIDVMQITRSGRTWL